MKKYTKKYRKGGNAGPIAGTSGASYVYNNYGGPNEQFNSVMNNNSSFLAKASNFLTPKWDPNLGMKGAIHNLATGMTGGRSRRKKHSHSRTKKKGGFFYEVVKQAIVPLTLWGISDKVSKKSIYKKRRD